MNAEKVIKELSQKYLGKKIIKFPQDNPAEIICEIDPATNHPEKSLAIAVIDKSKPHYHEKIVETHEVLRGKLTINKDGKDYKLEAGNKLIIEPGEVHFAIGDETWAKVYSEPGWTQEDHILVE